MKPLPSLCVALLAIATTTGNPLTAQTRPDDNTRLSSQGRKLESRYARQLDALRARLQRKLPKVSDSRRAKFLAATQAEKTAQANLKAAQDALGQVTTAKALVNHAKGKWIGGADRGIANAEKALQTAQTSAQKKAARQELAKWQADRKAGVQALAEREAALKKAQREEPKLNKAVRAAEAELEQAKANSLEALKGLRLDTQLASNARDAELAEFVVLHEATPKGMALFAQQGKAQRKLCTELLEDDKLMLQMVVADGAKAGKYGRAMEIYSEIQNASPHAGKGALQRLALAIALEHAEPISQRNPEAATTASTNIDPVARYRHYEEAFLADELDPAFDRLTVWDYRMVVNGHEPDETLAWGREMLRSYRPDHVYTSDYRWRYVAAVRTDIRYGSQDNQHDKPELQFFQNILMNGGVCGRRAFFGRFILRAFGVPTTARPQRGHAALAHWTPEGWVVCLGGGWGAGWTKTRYDRDLDFLATTQARTNPTAYLQVKRAQWIGDVAGERPVFGLQKGNPGFWYGVSLYRQQDIIKANAAVTLDAVGEELGEANESSVQYATEAATVTEADRQIVVDANGVITIPAVACSQPTKSNRKILFLPSNLGGKQLHYSRNGGAQPFEYRFDAPAAGTYALTARVVTPSWQQHLEVSVNDKKQAADIALPHTVGLWDTTEPVEVTLEKGNNVLRFEHKSDGYAKGFTIRDIQLSPVD